MKRTVLFVLFVMVAFSFALIPLTPKATEACDFPFEIPIDIKPGSDTNPVNVSSGGVLPVAIFGSVMDVTDIDVDSVVIWNEIGSQEPSRWSYEDIDKDGNLDLLIKFPLDGLVSSLDLDSEPEGATVDLILSGALSEGDTFYGQDSILIMNRKN